MPVPQDHQSLFFNVIEIDSVVFAEIFNPLADILSRSQGIVVATIVTRSTIVTIVSVRPR